MWAREGITYGQAAESREWFSERVGDYFFVADAGAVVGYCQGEPRRAEESVAAVLPLDTPYVEITNVYIRPDHRSTGIGSRLLTAVLDAAAADGVHRSLLFTGTKDVAGVLRFYERQGYRGWGVQLVR